MHVIDTSIVSLQTTLLELLEVVKIRTRPYRLNFNNSIIENYNKTFI